MRDLTAGDTVTADAIRSVRPGHGLSPKYTETVVGMRVTRAVRANTPTTWEVLEKP